MVIRVGVIGLGVPAGSFSPGQWAASAHLPSIQASPLFEIVALANSTVESAQRSIQSNNLPPTTAAYGSAEDLAKDPNVDLVVVSVRVEKHFALARAAIQQGKDVFVEWPLGASLQQSEQLTEMAKKAGVKTVVGVQGRSSRIVSAVKKILADGKIGRVVSSCVEANMSLLPVEEWWEGYEFYLDMKSGGNAFTIHFAHFLDSFVDVLGDFQTLQAGLHTQQTTVSLINLATREVIDPEYPRTAPDHIMVQGQLETGAVASIGFRHTLSSVDSVAIKWIISGTNGEIEVLFPERLGKVGSQWQTAHPGATLKVRVGREPEVELVDFNAMAGPNDAVAGLSPVAMNTGLLYDAFAHGEEEKYATFETALRTHRLLDRIARAAGAGGL
ncbi:putative oxidoreductase [Echria macrotheca]|uniref:Oxidoreductase n=1 Tax=Echria macrotheca TaxID=438768 RepID=A0AAJ0BCK0_9PEZI|nr:putative oxidoreductase [Echria macrotheca]